MLVYITTNLINGKSYIGADTINNPNYLGSGKLLLRAIKKYGRECFDKVIVEHCRDQQHLREREVYWIRYYKADESSRFYNMSHGGQGGVKGRASWNKGKKFDPNSDLYKKMYVNRLPVCYDYITDQWKKKHSDKVKSSKIFQANKHKKVGTRRKNNKEWHSDATKKKIATANKGKKMTKEQIEKRRNTILERGSLTGGKNPSAKQISVFDTTNGNLQIFDTIAEVCLLFNVTRYIIKKGSYNNLIFNKLLHI